MIILSPSRRPERLPAQLGGIGYVVLATIREPEWSIIERLVDGQLHGFSSSDVAQKIVCRWILRHENELEKERISKEDASGKGYWPVRWDEKLLSAPTRCGVHEPNPLEIELYGLPAYVVDELTHREVHGSRRDQTVCGIISNWLSEETTQ